MRCGSIESAASNKKLRKRKNHERNDFLNGLQLCRGEFVGANAIGGNQWPYQAKVMKIFEMVSSAIVRMEP